MLLSELKSVLSVRSQEMQERELRAVAQQRDVSYEEVLAEQRLSAEKGCEKGYAATSADLLC